MKTLRKSLTVKESVFDETKRDDTLDLVSLIDNKLTQYAKKMTLKYFEKAFSLKFSSKLH